MTENGEAALRTHEYGRCPICGKDDDLRWISVEVRTSKETGAGSERWVEEVYCSQEHFLADFARPIGDWERASRPAGSGRWGALGRALAWTCLLLFAVVWTIGLATVLSRLW